MVNRLVVNGENIEITKELKVEFENKNADITKLYHEADLLFIEKVLQSRESLIRQLQAGTSFEVSKERKKMWDDGRLLTVDEVSIPYHILQDKSDNPFVILNL